MSSASEDELPDLTARSGNFDKPSAHNGKGSDDEDIGDADLQDDLDDLFGDEVDGEAEEKARQRHVDDDDLDSGDDEGRYDRAAQNEEEAEMVEEDFNMLEIDMPRHPVPEPSDGEGYLLKVPRFVSIDSVAFSLHGFQPPTTDHHSTDPPSTGFSAYKTAQTTVRWRHSPSDPSELQSNARILRWSDGSLSLQLASDPTVQYAIAPKALAPPQRNPPKPTPTSIHDKSGRTLLNNSYDEKADTYTYLASASQEAFMVRITNKITTSLQVIPSTDGADEALERLQSSMQAALRGGPTGGPVTMEAITEDPELAKKKAEMAEKEKLKAQRRMEAQQSRERDRTHKVFSRGGARPGGLTVGDLEDGEGGAPRRAPRAKPRRQRRDDYSDDDEDWGGRARAAKEDHYDEEDDFIAASDEDDDRDAEGEDDEDIDAMIESREKEQRDRDRAVTPKRDRPREVDDDVEPEGAQGSSPVRTKRRRVVEEDDDE